MHLLCSTLSRKCIWPLQMQLLHAMNYSISLSLTYPSNPVVNLTLKVVASLSGTYFSASKCLVKVLEMLSLRFDFFPFIKLVRVIFISLANFSILYLVGNISSACEANTSYLFLLSLSFSLKK